jgi:Alginate export
MRGLHALMRTAALAVFWLLGWAVVARAAAPEMDATAYHGLRYNDDFSYLADPARSNDFWDGVKYVRIGDGPYGVSYVTFGGELRQRFESYLNPNFGLKAPPSSGYLLSRLTLDADVHLTDYVRAFVQLGEMDRIGNRGVSSTTDIDHLELLQGFVDFKPPSPLGDAPVVRIGREELLFGFQRLVAVREGPNVRRTFDGVRFSDRIGDAQFDLVVVRPVNPTIGVFDDHTNMKQLLTAGYLTVPVGAAGKIDLYAMDYENTAAKFCGLSGEETRQTFGARLFGAADGFDWNVEAAFQMGRFRNMDIHAGMLAAIVGYTVPGVAWQPRFAIEANYASGDNGRGNSIGTFNAMFPRLPYFAETSLLVPANLYDIQPVFSVRPRRDVLATFGWDSLWRASANDGLYGSGLVQYTNTNKVSGMFVGSEIFADIRWQVDQHLQIGGIAAEFLSGPAVQQALGKSVTFTVLYATYRF